MPATEFPVATTAQAWPVIVQGGGQAPKLREGKPSPDGRPTYASGCQLIVARNGEEMVNKSASVHVLEPAAIYSRREDFQAEGRVWVVPYESNGRVAYSITVERLVPVQVPKQGGDKA